jgi:hypothetical protein
MAAGKQLSDNNSSGTSLGQSATDTIGFYGVTPVAQQAAGTAVSTTAVTTTTPWGFSTSTQAQALVTLANYLSTVLHNLGLTA